MKARKLLFIPFLYCVTCLLVALGCSSASIIKDPINLPAIVRVHKHITLYGGGSALKDTGISIRQGEIYSIIPSDYSLMGLLRYKIGNEDMSFYPYYHNKATSSGIIYLGCPLQRGSTITFLSVDVLVWEKEDWFQIANFFEGLKGKDPTNDSVILALGEANRRNQIFVAEAEASSQIEETKKKLEDLQKGTKKPEQQAPKVVSEGKPASVEKSPTIEVSKEESVGQLEAKLAKLTETLAQLEEMKKQLSQEKEKTSLLSKELGAKEKREQELLNRLKDTSKVPPVIVIASPEDGSKVEANAIHLTGVAEDEQGVANLEIFLNKTLLTKRPARDIKTAERSYPRRLDFAERISLERGENEIQIRAVNSNGVSSQKTLSIHRVETRKNIWAVVIGIDAYSNVPPLKYAVNDAKAFYEYLVKRSQIPTENVTLLLDREASLSRLRSTLGTHLKNKASKEDMVILYFAGHGATETDVQSPDGDGLEKYLLPCDADPKDLYASAIPMREISYIFDRIRSERLIFIVDSCYSGASGGRTISTTGGFRASISETFLDRIAGGRGRIILTASAANEVSEEKDELKHGVFTYFLLDGLLGKADADKDGVITVDEIYGYVSKYVPQLTGQEQHPVKKGAVEGRLILGIVNGENSGKP
jgi:Tfp pilus assembly protein PilN